MLLSMRNMAAGPVSAARGARGARLAAYGAAAKGAMLLSYAGLGPDIIEYVVDRILH
jgi:hypothetical protein